MRPFKTSLVLQVNYNEDGNPVEIIQHPNKVYNFYHRPSAVALRGLVTVANEQLNNFKAIEVTFSKPA